MTLCVASSAQNFSDSPQKSAVAITEVSVAYHEGKLSRKLRDPITSATHSHALEDPGRHDHGNRDAELAQATTARPVGTSGLTVSLSWAQPPPVLIPLYKAFGHGFGCLLGILLDRDEQRLAGDRCPAAYRGGHPEHAGGGADAEGGH